MKTCFPPLIIREAPYEILYLIRIATIKDSNNKKHPLGFEKTRNLIQIVGKMIRVTVEDNMVVPQKITK